MPRIRQEHEEDDGWTRWIAPVMAGYKIVCCDCGLAHDMEFQVVKAQPAKPNGTWDHGDPLGEQYRVLFRVARNERSTAAIRREKAKKKGKGGKC